MGGGDLNTKKSWHPNTMKNQERVWKAEQAAAEEKKRILELQREREEERDRVQLKELAQRNFGAHSSGVSDNRLHWMYDKPDKQVQQEDYLLGKAIGKNDEGDNAPQNAIPALSRRVVGSSMTTTGDDSQVDLARKLREDPLLMVKERERAARAALLNNPLQRKKLTELLRKEKEEKESKSQSKKKSKKKGKDLDDVLAAKLNALAGNKGIDLTSLLNSEDSSDSSSSDEKSKKKKKKRKQKEKSKKSKKKQQPSQSDTESSDDDKRKSKKSSKTKKDKISSKSHKDKKLQSRKRRSDDSEYDAETKKKKSKLDAERPRSESESGNYKRKQESVGENFSSHRNLTKDSDRRDNDSIKDKRDRIDEGNKRDRQYRGSPPTRDVERRFSPESPPRRDSRRRASPKTKNDESRRNKRHGLSEEEKAARLAEMVAAGAEREVERGHRVAQQRAEEGRAAAGRGPRTAMQEARALPDSLEDRIRSNRHYIQRDRLHMNEHFARR